MNGLVKKPEGPWLIAAVIAAGLLVVALFLPLWRMELVAPQYPAGLVMRAYGDRFEGDAGTYYDDVREINGLNHYIGMRPIEEVSEMDLFIPGVLALIAGTLLSSFIAWKRGWFRVLIVAAFWFMPLFFVADLQYWLYNYGHTMDPEAALDTGDFTPDILRVKQGNHVMLHITNIEQTRDATHGFAIADYNIQASLEPGETATFEFTADKPGAYNFYCTEFCSALHLEMAGWLLVEPSAAAANP